MRSKPRFIKAFILLNIILLFSEAYAAKREVLYSSSNATFGPIWVFDDENGRRCLSFIPPEAPRFLQTCMYKNKPEQLIFNYAKMVLASLYVNPNPQKILILGLGGATIPKTLNKLVPNARIDIAEINPEIKQIAEKYFAFSTNENMHVFIKDGYDFIKTSAPNTYDLIIIDAYGKDHIPPSFLTVDFVKYIKNALSPSGVVAINTILNKEYYETVLRIYKSVFDKDLFDLNAENCKVILARNGALPSFDKIKKESSNWNDRFNALNVKTSWLINMFTKNQ